MTKKWASHEYDATFKVTASKKKHHYSAAQVKSVLERALGNRITDLSVLHENERCFSIGLLLNPSELARRVDLGPFSENASAIKEFSQFWGGKSELRRFKNGEIRESIVWDVGGTDVIPQIVSWILSVQLPSLQVTEQWGFGYENLLEGGSCGTFRDFENVVDMFNGLTKTIRSIRDLPLTITNVVGTCPALRYTAVAIPNHRFPTGPMDSVVTLESSAKWPNDLRAIQRVKIAFLAYLGAELEKSVKSCATKIGIENQQNDISNSAFLDVIMDENYTFRFRIQYERERSLLLSVLKTQLTAREKELANQALRIYDTLFRMQIPHSAQMQRLCQEYPALSPSIRLVKRFINAQLLSTMIPEEAIELLTAESFVDTGDLPVPGSMASGFCRTVRSLARWDWSQVPIFVNMLEKEDTLVTQQRSESATTTFEQLRKQDPYIHRSAFFIASDLDESGLFWTSQSPSKLSATRISQVAKASRDLIFSKPKVCFNPDLSPYDFLIMLDPACLCYGWQNSYSAGHKSIKERKAKYKDSTGNFDPVAMFLNELQDAFGKSLYFFYNAAGGEVIGGLFDPTRLEPRAFRPRLAYDTVPYDESKVRLNPASIINQIGRLGDGLVLEIRLQNQLIFD